jgi:hypothetical protein
MADGHTGLDFTVRTCQLALTAGSLKSWPVTWTRVGYSAIHYTREAGKVQELIPMTVPLRSGQPPALAFRNDLLPPPRIRKRDKMVA